MKAYKRVSDEFADAFLGGSVRLGTAEEFRQLEENEVGRGDRNELARTAHILCGSETLSSDHPTLIDKVFFYKGGVRQTVDMVTVGETAREILDAYLFCCSLTVDETDTRLGEALIEIADIEEFGRRLAARSELNWREHHSGRVTYRVIEDAPSLAALTPVDPFEKHESFRWQDEYRLTWAMNMWEKPMILSAPEVSDLLHR